MAHCLTTSRKKCDTFPAKIIHRMQEQYGDCCLNERVDSEKFEPCTIAPEAHLRAPLVTSDVTRLIVSIRLMMMIILTMSITCIYYTQITRARALSGLTPNKTPHLILCTH